MRAAKGSALHKRPLLLCVQVLFVLSACSFEKHPSEELLARGVGPSVAELVSNEDFYDGDSIRLSACVSVTPHTMSLVDCDDEDGPAISFSPGTNSRPYEEILEAGFRSYDSGGARLSVRIRGTFAVNEDLPRHNISVETLEELKVYPD